ncbi:MAG: PilZ domain-containing protein [Thiotrichales bacterium]
MQHRLHPRIRVNLKVRIYPRGGAMRRGQVTDLSHEGAFLAVRWNDDLHAYRVVDVAFQLVGDAQVSPLRFPALIIHRQPQSGVGLMFLDTDAERARILDVLLRGPAAPFYRLPSSVNALRHADTVSQPSSVVDDAIGVTPSSYTIRAS